MLPIEQQSKQQNIDVFKSLHSQNNLVSTPHVTAFVSKTSINISSIYLASTILYLLMAMHTKCIVLYRVFPGSLEI